MMGQQTRNESLLLFPPGRQIPEDHLLRLIDHYVDLNFVRERLRHFYSGTGRPSIDPEVLLRLLLVGWCNRDIYQQFVKQQSHATTFVGRLTVPLRVPVDYGFFETKERGF